MPRPARCQDPGGCCGGVGKDVAGPVTAILALLGGAQHRDRTQCERELAQRPHVAVARSIRISNADARQCQHLTNNAASVYGSSQDVAEEIEGTADVD